MNKIHIFIKKLIFCQFFPFDLLSKQCDLPLKSDFSQIYKGRLVLIHEEISLDVYNSKTQKNYYLRGINNIPSLEALIREDRAQIKTELTQYRQELL